MSPMAFTPRRYAGFTLIELMTVIFVMAILISVAVPSFTNTIRDNATNAAAGEFSAAIALAKSEAVKRSRPVTICPRGGGAGCGANWADGWIVVFEEANVQKGAAPTVDLDNVVGEFGSLQRNELTLDTANQWIRFSPRGLLETAANLTILPKAENCSVGALQKNISLGVAGRLSIISEKVSEC